MIRINLLPPDQRPAIWRLGRIFLTMTLVLVFLCCTVFGFLETTLYFTQLDLEKTKERYELLSPMRAKKAQADVKLGAISQKQNILTALTGERQSCFLVLSQLGVKTPAQLWLTDLEIEKGLVKISAFSKSYPDLVQFLNQLEQDTVFSDPVLIKVEQSTVPPANKFDMTAKIRRK